MMVGKQAGVIGILTVLSKKHEILSVASNDNMTSIICNEFHIPFFETIYDKDFINNLKKSDLFICVHGREIVSKEILNQIKCINVHPCIYKYKGRSPIKRMLEDGEKNASVGIHYMTEKIDYGEIITEKFVDVSGLKTVISVYNKLYPYYFLVISKALDIICDSNVKK